MRGFVVLVLIALVGRVAAEPNPNVAKRLFAEGRVLYDQGKYIEACVLFEKSYQLDPAVGTKLNLAECAERDGKPRAAWLLWVSAADEFEVAKDQREGFARDRADALAPKLATVVVKVAKPKTKGLVIQIAGRDVEPAREIVDRLDPGAIVVSAKAPDRQPFETTITVALGGKLVVEVPPLMRIGGKEEEPEAPSSSGTNRWWAAAITGGVITALATGAYLFSYKQIKDVEAELALAINGTPPDPIRIEELNDEGFAWEARTRIALGITLGALVVSSVLVVKAVRVDRHNRAATTAWKMSPVISPQVAGAQVELRW